MKQKTRGWVWLERIKKVSGIITAFSEAAQRGEKRQC